MDPLVKLFWLDLQISMDFAQNQVMSMEKVAVAFPDAVGLIAERPIHPWAA